MPPSPLPRATPPPTPPSPTVSVIIPTLNEEQNLPFVLEALPPVDEVIVVDGGSTDDTVAVAREVRPDATVVRQTRAGKGNALACGFAASSGDIVVTLNGDGSADPGDLPRYVDALLSGAEVAHGSRYRAGGGTLRQRRLDRFGNWVLAFVVNVLFGTRFTDVCCGYNALWRSLIPALGLPAPDLPRVRRGTPAWGDGSEVEPLVTIRMAARNLRVAEVATVGYPRLHGRRPRRRLHRLWGTLRALLAEYARWLRRGAHRNAPPRSRAAARAAAARAGSPAAGRRGARHGGRAQRRQARRDAERAGPGGGPGAPHDSHHDGTHHDGTAPDDGTRHHDSAYHDSAYHDSAYHDSAYHDSAYHDTVRLGPAHRGPALHDTTHRHAAAAGDGPAGRAGTGGPAGRRPRHGAPPQAPPVPSAPPWNVRSGRHAALEAELPAAPRSDAGGRFSDTGTHRLGDTGTQRSVDGRLSDTGTHRLGDTGSHRLGDTGTHRLSDTGSHRLTGRRGADRDTGAHRLVPGRDTGGHRLVPDRDTGARLPYPVGDAEQRGAANHDQGRAAGNRHAAADHNDTTGDRALRNSGEVGPRHGRRGGAGRGPAADRPDLAEVARLTDEVRRRVRARRRRRAGGTPDEPRRPGLRLIPGGAADVPPRPGGDDQPRTRSRGSTSSA